MSVLQRMVHYSSENMGDKSLSVHHSHTQTDEFDTEMEKGNLGSIRYSRLRGDIKFTNSASH